MLLGIPEWDSATDRGEALCQRLGLELRFLDSGYVNGLLGRPADAPDWLGDFRRHFPDDDVDVIGTLAIRLGLADTAREVGAGCAITGLNLEDLLAECFLRLVQGELPLAFPVRVLDGLPFTYPLYRVPKKILDGCHPRYALENYQDRSTGVMMGRAIPYYLAQSVNAAVPGLEFDVLDGFRRLPHVQPVTDPAYGFATIAAPGAEPEIAGRWERYIAGEPPEFA